MSVLAPSMASHNSLKRPFGSAQLCSDPLQPSLGMASPSQVPDITRTEGTGAHMTNDPRINSVHDSSSSINPSSSQTSNSPVQQNPTDVAMASNPPKRRKITAAEKEEQRLNKEHQDQQKAAENARREKESLAKEAEREEKRKQKDEEKRLKDEEKEQKRQAKEADKKAKDDEKRAKEDEKRAKEEDKAKKAKSQLRMTSFFLKQPTHSGSVSSSRRNSISSVEGPISGTGSRAASVDTEQKPSDYQKTFQPFFRKEYTTLAPPSKLSFIPESLAFARQQAELCFAREASSDAYPKLKQSNVFTRSRKWGHGKQQSVRNLVSQIQSSDSNTIDLTQEDPLRLLKNVPLKFLKYAEDVRPPYVGTYTKTPVDCSVATLCRNPFKRALPLVAYDYDSEVEWEEPEEGEDLDSEGEEELDEEDVDDMDGFLDDDDVEGPKRRHIMGDIEPVSTGIRWVENTNEKEQVVPFGKSTLDLTTLRVESLLLSPSFPIDPYSTVYWKSSKNSTEMSTSPSGSSSMAPPRVPLHALKGFTNQLPSTTPDSASKMQSTLAPSMGSTGSKSTGSGVTQPVPPELMAEFKKAIDGSDLTKAGLVEVLKKRFPSLKKNTVQEALQQVAKRVGKKEAEKRWCLI